MSRKSIAIDQLAQHAKQLRDSGKRIVATNGCFDLLHVGHVRYLRAARAMGDVLIVGVNGDESVRALKGAGRPVNRDLDRAEVVAALETVDFVTIFQEVRATRFLQAVKPAIYVKAGDYALDTLDAEERDALQRVRTKIQFVPFEEGYSTSGLLQRLGRTAK